MATAQGTAPLQTIVVGNTIPARNFTYTVNSVTPSITEAWFAVKTPGGKQLIRVACAIAGGVVTRPVVAASVTANWPVGRLNWDIETTVSSQEKTWVFGEFLMLKTAQ